MPRIPTRRVAGGTPPSERRQPNSTRSPAWTVFYGVGTRRFTAIAMRGRRRAAYRGGRYRNL
ncbi:hypothetical protein Sme01_34510 [Sphaerisporangium melleum]|uniref:Uncharacterized protein n=1 Tax=Sphaerisporangium melleum TaxID=321316 RepID=A0A917QX55_9ACTN|nr:hypothetical protein GCM10007964_17190 [Sphaerisporangium melleum]GII70975.1 hypothetical protein Sme01_34510 [Sphaerisporangium melleum]